MVDWYVCFRRGKLNGPGTKSRAIGSEDGGDWMGCSGPRLYLGGWYWYLGKGSVRVCTRERRGQWARFYLEPGRLNFLSFARFHGLNCLFSSSLNGGALRRESVSRSVRTASASAACDEAHLLEPAVYVWRGSWGRCRLRAGLDSPRRLAMADTRDRAGVLSRGASAKKLRDCFAISGEIFWVM